VVVLARCALLLIVLASCGEGSGPGRGDGAAPGFDGATTEGGTDQAAPSERPPADATSRDGALAGEPDALGAGEAAATCPPQAALDLSWVTAYQTELIARLTGAMEIEPGLTLTNRGTPTTREAARGYLERSLRSLGLSPQLHSYGTGTNVFASIPATTGSPQNVLIGGHFDTVPRSPGANDNASGVAVVLAAARALGQLGCRSKTVLLVLFDEEEVGLVGSKQFAVKLAADRTVVHSVHTVDQVAWDADGDALMELERPDRGLAELYDAALRPLGLTLELVRTTTNSADHASFRPRYPSIGITEGYVTGDTSPHRHRPTDTLATINFPYLRTATLVTAQVLASLLR
jgi:hypothetical protein